MQVFRGIPRPGQRVACALTIGNFDGVQRGHQALLARVVAAAKARGIAAAVMTFEPHPRELFAPDRAPMRISALRDKLEALADHGIDRVIVQHFSRSFAASSADAFIDLLIRVPGALGARRRRLPLWRAPCRRCRLAAAATSPPTGSPGRSG